jgi:hypothetical protein
MLMGAGHVSLLKPGLAPESAYRPFKLASPVTGLGELACACQGFYAVWRSLC